ncbi:MAG: recombinase family protein [Blautia sp.]|nr:recombinase family protein [Blautia sp.]
METINGEWIMKGCDPSDPEALHSSTELISLIHTIGFLPLFSNSIPGFSVEERVPSYHWWTGDTTADPWEWRIILSRDPSIAYGKFFNKSAGFVAKDFFPTFANYRRNGYDFDSLFEDELASYRAKKIMDVFELDDERKNYHGHTDGFVWTAASVGNILKNEEYTGALVTHKSESTGPGCKREFFHKGDWRIVEGTHEAIVTKEVFVEVQKMTRKVGMRPAVQKGFFRCGYCGRALNNQNLKTCSMRCRRGKLSDDTACAKVSLKNVKAMDCVLKAIKQKIRTYMDAEERRKAGWADNDPQKEIQSVQKIIEKEKTSWMKLYDKYADGKMSREDFLQYKRKYDDRVKRLKQRLETAEMLKRQMKADEGEDAGRFEEVLETTELTQEIMNVFIDHVDVFDGDRIHIHWKFDPEG